MASSVPDESGTPHPFNDIHRFFEFSLDLFAISGFDGYLKRVNPAWENTLGYTAEELLSRPAIEFVHPEDRDVSLTRRQQAHSGSLVINFENRYLCKDGSVKWLEWMAHPYPEDGLNYVVGRDITERKLAEMAVEESENRFRMMADTAPVLIWMSGKDKLCDFFNQPWLNFRGRSMEQEVGNGWTEGVHPDDFERCLKTYSEAFDAHRTFEMEYRLQGADGRYRWIFDQGVPRFAADGEFLGYIGSCTDLHDRKLAEDTLRQTEQAMRGLLNGMPNQALLMRSDGSILMANDRQAAGFGLSLNELVGKNIYDLTAMETEAMQQRRVMVQEAIASGQPIVLEVERDGNYFETTLTPIRSEAGEVTSVVISGHDITQLKQIEQERLDNQRLQMEVKQERELIQLRQQFMSMVSHEFRTPLTVIASSTEILQHYDDRLSRERRMEKLQVINGQVRAMVTLLDDILALNKIQAGATDFSPESVDLLALCLSVLNNIKIMDQDQHQFIFDTQATSAPVLADRRSLEHSITNLLANAVKYSPPETTIHVSVHSAEKNINLEIRDHGIGIPPAEQEHLFEPFYRASNARKIDGTGLGLTIVKHNVEQHGGTITCRSTEGKGTTFSIRLPMSLGI